MSPSAAVEKSTRIQHIVRVRQMLRRWRRRSSSASSSLSCRLTATDVPAGHVAVCVGPNCRRYIVRATHLNHPVFQKLLTDAEEEYGFANDGPLTIPCEESVFEEILRFVSRPGIEKNGKKQRFLVDLDDFQRCCHVDYVGESQPLLHGSVCRAVEEVEHGIRRINVFDLCLSPHTLHQLVSEPKRSYAMPPHDPIQTNLGVKINVEVDHVNDIGLPQYDEAEYTEDDVSYVLIWQQTCLSPLMQDSFSSMATVQGKNCHFIVDSYNQKQLAIELKPEFIDVVIEKRSSEKYVFNHANMVRHAIKNTGIDYLGPLNDQELVKFLLHDYTTATNMTNPFSALVAISLKPGKACDDTFANLYDNASRQESNDKGNRICMIQEKIKKVVWDKNIYFSKWKRRLLKILLKIKQIRGRILSTQGE
ncbi:hypothetical protein OSB04_014821 [Centaurea solstitialis]|uniref:Peptidase M1 alanyl aminopeptidase C-terminal domain-containing protein n=1 Tax=Centaurea solstitialis TaxID=347529 RepID=A0AA38WJI7_9ASTR|nr:hypothetical protein OSB04_014821 [Centaurea solstitialis]